MLLDFDQTDQTHFTADVCIIGTGAAGLTCALSLRDSGKSVLLLESGDVEPRAAHQQLNEAEIVGDHHVGVHEARGRSFGGTTTQWGGQAFPFLPEDFAPRPHIGIKGWPIELEDLQPYYEKAEEIVGTDPSVPFDYNPWEDRAISTEGLSDAALRLLVTKWAKTPNFRLLHGATIEAAESITLLYHATTTELLPAADAHVVDSLTIKSLSGKEGRVQAREFIVATGAYESCRLLLNSKRFYHKGLGNRHNLVGRYIQDHISAIVGRILPTDRNQFHELFDPFYRNGYKYLPRILVEPTYAQENKLLHSSGQIVFNDEGAGEMTALKTGLRQLKNRRLPNAATIRKALHPRSLRTLAGAAHRLNVQQRGVSPRTGGIWLEVLCEQAPAANSRVTLSRERDILGVPKLRLDWRIPPATYRTLTATARLLQQEFQRAGVADIELEAWLDHPEKSPFVKDVFHQAGGLVMGNNPEQSVVDADCRVHGVNNLSIASAAVFPTSSFANITLTIMALAIRICDRLKAQSASE